MELIRSRQKPIYLPHSRCGGMITVTQVIVALIYYDGTANDIAFSTKGTRTLVHFCGASSSYISKNEKNKSSLAILSLNACIKWKAYIQKNVYNWLIAQAIHAINNFKSVLIVNSFITQRLTLLTGISFAIFCDIFG